jgi:hypothetical protein
MGAREVGRRKLLPGTPENPSFAILLCAPPRKRFARFYSLLRQHGLTEARR